MPIKNGCYKDISLSDDELLELREVVLTRQQPLGHHALVFTDDRCNPDLYQMLFNWHPEHFHESPGMRPSIILGRRGSGKSSYLNNLSHKDHVIPVPIKSWDIVDLVEAQVDDILKNQASIDAEKVADIWLIIFLVLTTKAAIKSGLQSKQLKQLLKELPIEDISKASLTSVAMGVMALFKEKYISASQKSSVFNASLVFESMQLGFNSLSSWETALSKVARANGKYIILMIDNPEQIDNKIKTIDEAWNEAYSDSSKARWHTYAGLLHLLSQFNTGKVGVQARYCVAAEQYFYLQDRSTANLKDFGDIQLLHWSAGDLLSSLAHRYMVFLQVHPGNRDEQRYRDLKKFKIYTGAGAKDFFRYVFKPVIENERGQEEDCLGYLLRHTQLLPRQLIFYVNCALRKALEDNDSADLTTLDSKYIAEAISQCEELLANEVIQSFSSSFPEGREVINGLLGFPIVGEYGSLLKKWKGFGAHKTLEKYQAFPGINVDDSRFFRLLFEIGFLGRIDNEDQSNYYLNSSFEYTLPLHMRIDPADEVAVHPLFSKYADSNTYELLGDRKGIYPRGTDVNDIQDLESIRKRYVCRLT